MAQCLSTCSDAAHPHRRDSVKAFTCIERPDVLLVSYAAHLFANVPCEATWSGAVALLQRIADRELLPINAWTVHRVVLVALLVAHKVLSDDVYSNAGFAEVGLVALEDLNHMECVLLVAMDFDVHVDRRHVATALKYFETWAAGLDAEHQRSVSLASPCSSLASAESSAASTPRSQSSPRAASAFVPIASAGSLFTAASVYERSPQFHTPRASPQREFAG